MQIAPGVIINETATGWEDTTQGVVIMVKELTKFSGTTLLNNT